MIVYVAGCSKTEGTGLSDQYLFPNEYPGEIEVNKINKVAWTNKRTSLITKDPFLFEKLRQENLKRAWPAKLGDLIKGEVINGAVGGASMQSMAMTLIHDLENLSNDNKLPDLVFIGVTTPERIPLLNLYPINNYTTLAFKNVLPNFISNIDKRYAAYCEEFWTSHSDEEMLTFMLYHCVMMKNYILAKTGKEPIFLRMVRIEDTEQWKSIVENSNIFLLKEYWNLLKFDKIVHMKGIEDFCDPPNIVLPDGHFKENAHEGYAQFIKKEFLNV